MSDSADTIYETITERIITMLEEGTVPWRKPWNAGTAPRNIEGNVYRGINLFLLSLSGYESPFWLTFNQARKRGGKVKKGEKSTMVVFWKRLMITEKETGERKMIPMLKYYRVFNLAQTEGVKLPKRVAEFDAQKVAHEERVEAESIVKGYPNPPSIREGSEAYYLPGLDSITVPPLSAYKVRDEYYSTLFHEIGHSTGHPDRLARKYGTTFGSHDYGREELVAEMTAAFLCAEAGIEITFENSAAYLRSWIKTIREDTRAVVVAAGAAQRAADHVLGRTFEDKKDDEGTAPAVEENKEVAA